jgi:HTH-type transcriptional regulator/antitoxin HipB
MKDSILRNPEQLGRAIRLKRLEKGLSQKALAEKIGVERKWIIRLESGNSRAELGLILKALDVLNIQTSLGDRKSSSSKGSSSQRSRLDEVFEQLHRTPK